MLGRVTDISDFELSRSWWLTFKCKSKEEATKVLTDFGYRNPPPEVIVENLLKVWPNLFNKETINAN